MSAWVVTRPECSPKGEQHVGTRLDLRHLEPTPVGFTVTARVELVEVDRRRLVFRAEVRDDAGIVGEGTHERMIVPWARFLARIEDRRRTAGP